MAQYNFSNGTLDSNMAHLVLPTMMDRDNKESEYSFKKSKSKAPSENRLIEIDSISKV